MRKFKFNRHRSFSLLTLAALLTTAWQVEAQPANGLLTRAEQSGYTETTRHDEALVFLESIAESSPYITIHRFGYSNEGRPLLLAVVGELDEMSSTAIRHSDLTRVYIQGNIHGGEVEGKEATLMLLRELANGEHREWLETMILLIAPIYNADGNERIALTHRSRQHGPIGGVGQRPNAQGYDLNRDHMKLESPEARSFVKMLKEYDPHVLMDLHATNGTYHGYHLTYAPPLHPNTAIPIVDLLSKRLLPTVTRTIKDAYGWDFYYYGNTPRPGSGRALVWYTFDHRPRFGNNYGGLRNRVSILSEAYSYLPFKDRITVTKRFVEEILNYVETHGEAIRAVVESANGESIIGQQLTVRAGFKQSVEPVDILLGEVMSERHPYTGQQMLRRLDIQTTTSMYEYGTFAASAFERVPRAYYVPSNLENVIERLEAHGIHTELLDAESTREVEQFQIGSTSSTDREFQGHRERTLTGSYELTQAVLAAGTRVVPLDQPLGRLVFMLLEPMSDDGFVNWNLLDDVLVGAAVYPIVRTVE